MKTLTTLSMLLSLVRRLAPAVSFSAAVVMLAAAPQAAAQTTFSFVPDSGEWGVDANWDQGSVPNDIDNTTANISYSKVVTVSGSYSTGYLYLGSGASLTVSGSGSSLTLGTLGGSSNTTGLQTSSGTISVEDGASLTITGNTILGSGTSDEVTYATLSVTNASVTLGNIQFMSTDADVQAQLVINEGGSLYLNYVSTGGISNSTLVFNGGTTGFGQLTANNLISARIGNLAIYAGDYTGTGTFTLIDATKWTDAFNTITFNGTAYTLGTDVEYNGLTWNIDQSGTTLVLTVIPEVHSTAMLLGLAALLGLVMRRRSLRRS